MEILNGGSRAGNSGGARSFTRRAMLVLLAAGAAMPGFGANAPEARESDLKAAFLLNFARYIQWPADAFPSADAPLTIAVLGDRPIAAALAKAAAGERAGARAIVVQSSLGRPCHMIFVGKVSAAQLDAALGRAGAGCLAVGDSDDFLRRGGAIRFFSAADRKVRFELNPRALDRRGLKASANILRVARLATDGR